MNAALRIILATTSKYDAEVVGAAHSEAMATAEKLPGGQYYSKTTFRSDGKPILCNADGSRSIFCDVDE